MNLLRRNIAPSEILKTSFAEWRRNAAPGRSHTAEKMAEMQAVLTISESAKASTRLSSRTICFAKSTTPAVPKTYATKS